jgi:hypothetical protein
MSGAVPVSERKQFIPLDLAPVPLQQDEAERKTMYGLVQRWQRTYESWHGPLKLPSREEFLSVCAGDFTLTSNGSTYICGVEACLELIKAVVASQIDVTMSAVILEVAENTAWIYDVHAWILPDGYRFESGRYGRLYRRKGENQICRWEIMQTNPIAAQEFFDTRYRFGRCD